MGVRSGVNVWGDVFSEELDEMSAPSLGQLYLGEEVPGIFRDPFEFFKRTLIARNHLDILENVARRLAGEGGYRVISLQSLFGGGKTHTLAIVYHALRKPEALLDAKLESEDLRERLGRVVQKLKELGGVDVVVVDGTLDRLAPVPSIGVEVGRVKVRTIWGIIAHELGLYGEVRDYDEKVTSPGIDRLSSLFKGRRVIILIDEIGNYIGRLSSSSSEVDRNYLEALPSFFEVLVKAVDVSGSAVLVISLPYEERSGDVEKSYEKFKDKLVAVYKAVHRVDTLDVLPVEPRTLPLVLRARLFEKVDESVARSSRAIFQKEYQKSESVFGAEALNALDSFLLCYPFHPSYIKTLTDLIDKHESLQKTRDAIRISRMVVRRLWRLNENPEAIMPWHISLDDEGLRSRLLSHESYRMFELVYSEDGVKKTREYSKSPELAKVTYTTLLLKTFYLPPSWKKLDIYPSEAEVAIAVYEPSKFQALKMEPKDVLDVLKWMSQNLVSVYGEEGRYWVSAIKSPVKEVEARARTYKDLDVRDDVLKAAGELMKSSIEELAAKRRKGKPKALLDTVFDAELSRVLDSCEPVDVDERKYVLLVCLEKLSEPELEELVYRTRSGGSRRNANTVFVLHPGEDQLKQVYEHAKLLRACEDVEGDLDALYPEPDVRDVMKKKLERYCHGEEGVEYRMYSLLDSALNKLAYPSYEEGRGNCVKETDANDASPLLIKAQKALEKVKPEKYKRELSFDTLAYLLRSVGVDLEDENFRKPVSSILEYFYTNPRLPIVRTESVVEALAEGVKNLSIGLLRPSGELVFKNIRTCSLEEGEDEARCLEGLPQVDEGPSVSVSQSDEVVSWKYALKHIVSTYSTPVEEEIAGGIRRIEYAFSLGGRLVRVAELKGKIGDRGLLEQLRSAPLVKIVRVLKVGVLLKPTQNAVEAWEGEAVPEVEVVVERVGSFSGSVRLEASVGDMVPSEVSFGEGAGVAKAVLRLPSLEPGSYDVEIRAYRGGELLHSARVQVTVKARRGESLGVPPPTMELEWLSVTIDENSLLTPLQVLEKKLGDRAVVAEGRITFSSKDLPQEGRVEVALANMRLSQALRVLLGIVRLGGLLLSPTSGEFVIKSASGGTFRLPELSEDEKKSLEGRVKYVAAG